MRRLSTSSSWDDDSDYQYHESVKVIDEDLDTYEWGATIVIARLHTTVVCADVSERFSAQVDWLVKQPNPRF